MSYKVTVQKENGCWYCVAAFSSLSEAIIYAGEKTHDTGNYHLIEVIDGGKH